MVGNVPPGEQLKITLKYIECVKLTESGSYAFAIPRQMISDILAYENDAVLAFEAHIGTQD